MYKWINGVVDRIMAPKDVLILEICGYVRLHGKGKLNLLIRDGEISLDYLGGPKYPYKRKAEGTESERDLKMLQCQF